MKTSSHLTSSVPWRRAITLAAIAAVVKVAVLLQLRDHPLLQPHGELDTAYYISLSQRIAAEGLLAPVGAFVVSPAYVYFLAGIFALGGSVLAAQIVQAALGSIAIGLSYGTARHWFGERAALVGATLAILTGPFTFNEVLVLQSALDPFLAALALYALTRAASGAGAWAVATAGASLAIFALNRPNALFCVAAAIVAASIVRWRESDAKSASTMTRLRQAGAVPIGIAVAFALVLAFNALRNYAVSGDAVLIASHGGLNFYIGNHEHADGTYTPVPGITPSIAGQIDDSRRVAEAAVGRTLTPTEVSGYFTWRAIDWITAHPADAARLTARKAAILLNRIDVPLNHSFAFYTHEPRSFLRMLAVGPWLLLPLGVVGLLWPALRVQRRGYWVWGTFAPVYGMSVVVFFVADRYRLPMFVPLCGSAGAALVGLFDLARARRVAPLIAPAGAITLLALVAFADLGLDDGRSAEQTRKAVWLVEKGSFDESRVYVNQIVSGHSHTGVLQYRVGRALVDADRYGDAVPLLRQAIAIDGPQPAIRLALADALIGSGKVGEAVPLLQAVYDEGVSVEVTAPMLVRALAASNRGDEALARIKGMATAVARAPDARAVALDFGTLALEHGAPEEALRWLPIAVERAPELAEAHEKLGVALFLGGDAPGAAPHLERACALDPASASAQLNLAAVYAQLGRVADARRHATEARRLDPAEPRAAALLSALPK